MVMKIGNLMNTGLCEKGLQVLMICLLKKQIENSGENPMVYPSIFTLVNPQNGNLAFKLFMFEDNGTFDHIQRNNYFSLIWIKEGTGICKVDFNEFIFKENSLF